MANRKSEKRRLQILLCAQEVFADKGYHEAKIEDIVVLAKVARGTFYLYFDDKRSIFEELLDDFFVRVSSSISRIDVHDATRSALAQLRGNVQRVVAFALEHPAMTKILFTTALGVDAAFDRKMMSFYTALYRLLRESLEEGQGLGLVRHGDSAVLTALATGALKEMLTQAVLEQIPANAEMLTHELMRFMASGLLTRDALVDSALTGPT